MTKGMKCACYQYIASQFQISLPFLFYEHGFGTFKLFFFFSLCQLSIKLVSRGYWKGIVGRRGFPSWFQCAHLVDSCCLCGFSSSQLLQYRQLFQHPAPELHDSQQCPLASSYPLPGNSHWVILY